MSDPVVLLSTGDVVGPAGGVTDNSMVLFSGTSGKLIKGNNAVVTAAGLALIDDVNAAAQRVTLGLGNVDNTSDIDKPISTATQTALNLKANINSPTFTGVPSAPTASPGTATTQLANTAFVKAAVDAAPMLGVGQTWQDVTASRNLGVNYTNTTGKAITVIQVSAYLEPADLLSVYINGLLILSVDQGIGPAWYGPVTFIVPNGATYAITKPVSPNIRSWLELRS